MAGKVQADNLRSWNTTRFQRARLYGGITGLRYLVRLLRPNAGVAAERRDAAAKSLLQIGLAGLPPIPQAQPQFPSWVTSIIETRTLQLKGDRDLGIDRGGVGALPDQDGEKITTDSISYVQESQPETIEFTDKREVLTMSPSATGDSHIDNEALPDSSPPIKKDKR